MDPIKEEEVQEKSKFIISIESYLNTGCCSVCNYFRIGKKFSSAINKIIKREVVTKNPNLPFSYTS